MANRLAFDIGLHLDCRNNGMPEHEVQIRRMAMRACAIYDKYWALFLGRPTSIKSEDLGMEMLSEKLSMLSSDFPTPPEKDLIVEIYEQLLELMELAGRIVQSRDHHVLKKYTDANSVFGMSEAEGNAYLHVINLDRQLQNWYRRLPDHLTWKPSNIKTAPWSFFLLHQQYHVSMVLLHRPWAKYGSITGDGASTGSHPSPDSGHMPVNPDAAAQHPGLSGEEHSLGMGDPHSMVHDSRASLSRSICTQQAIRVARIFWQHRQRFDGRKIHVTGIQHAGTAVLALIAALAYQRSDSDRRTYMGYLEILSDALGDMSHTYHPAGRMHDLLKAVMGQIRLSLDDGPPNNNSHQAFSVHGANAMSGCSDMSAPLVPSRREAEDTDFGQPFKKRRPGNSRRASEFARPPPPFFNNAHAQPTPPHSAQRQHMFGDMDHQRHHSQVDQMLFSLGATDGSDINLDFLNGSAIDMDGTEDRGKNDRMDLVAPSTENWGFHSLNSDHQASQFDAPVNDFGPGPAGLSASSVLGQSSAISNGLMSNASFGLKDDEVDTRGGNAMLGMGDQGLNGMSPVSLSELVQKGDKEGNESTSAPRNHDLDFFSFN